MRDKLVDKDITKLLINMGNHVSLHQLIPPEDGFENRKETSHVSAHSFSSVRGKSAN